jgi:hypothetical protein
VIAGSAAGRLATADSTDTMLGSGALIPAGCVLT